MYGIGLILGAGIYLIIGDVAGIAGNAMWISFIVAAFIALMTGFSYAELSSIFPKSAAEYVYTLGETTALSLQYTKLTGIELDGHQCAKQMNYALRVKFTLKDIPCRRIISK